ncbi:MAG: alanine--tRNA ligase [Deltaproteobacteria bacterium]|nr:alanine--tRNA ligase [Deltaproteobacteria bacterium]
MKSETVRSRFLKFFEDRGHRVVSSHSLTPPDDPSLLFVNAGMVQFKDVFTGDRDPGYKRAASSQKCLRVSGKHNDLEEVGRTPRHHTFFEMLGNFSFGDYFKKDAIGFGWELLTGEYALKAGDLLVTVHPDDDEARRIWTQDVGVDPERVLDDPDNFWSMGDTGPCGPCSEIHIDRGPSFKGTDLLKDPGDRFMELWNLVFMQYDRDAEGALSPLPAPSIDTGMGLERICAVLQGARSNYDTDLFLPLMQKTAEVAGIEIGSDEETDTALRVIADHARATAFLISDGVYPDNEGRGYVLRRLMRRALRYGNKLGLTEPFFVGICLEVSSVMGDAWPELARSADVIRRIGGNEEERFLKTLSSGMDLLDEAIRRTEQAGGKEIDGGTVFTLYDTHGFPADLTKVIASEHGLGIDQAGFDREMEQQRRRGRASWSNGGDRQALDTAVKRMIEIRGARGGRGFVGYDTLEADSEVVAMYEGTGPVKVAGEGREVFLFTRETPFYGESGGQVGDTGVISGPRGRAVVLDTKKPKQDVILHVVRITEGEIRESDGCHLRVDGKRRDLTRKNHSATHLLHHALRLVLGNHVRQRGSLVSPERLRFDFSHTGAMTPDEVSRVEDAVASWVLADHEVLTDVTDFEDAVARGALHFFGDKYGNTVRMVTMGESVELCGGTHVARTGEIGLVKVISETGISAGVRRIEAISGPAVLERLRDLEGLVGRVGGLLKTEPSMVVKRVERLIAGERSLQKELQELKLKAAAGGDGDEAQTILESGGTRVMAVSGEGIQPKALRELADVMRGKVGSGLVLITRREGDRLMVLLAATRDVVDSHPSNLILKEVLGGLGGRGGGSPALAQGGVQGVDGKRVLDELLKYLQTSG